MPALPDSLTTCQVRLRAISSNALSVTVLPVPRAPVTQRAAFERAGAFAKSAFELIEDRVAADHQRRRDPVAGGEWVHLVVGHRHSPT